MDFGLNKTWGGIGTKFGGHLFLIGADSFEGGAFRLDDWPSKSAVHVNVTNIRGGPGLGGGIGMSLIFAFNTPVLAALENTLTGRDWGLNLALPGEKIGISKLSVKVLKGLTGGADLIKSFDAKRLEGMRELASIFYSVLYDVGEASKGNESKVVVVDVPEAGWGAEISGFLSWGEIHIGDRITSISD